MFMLFRPDSEEETVITYVLGLKYGNWGSESLSQLFKLRELVCLPTYDLNYQII